MPDGAKKADWTYRIINMVLSAGIALGVAGLWDQIKTVAGLSGKVDKLITDQATLAGSVEEMKRTQSGFATGADVQALRSDVDKLTGRVDTLQEQVNGLGKPGRPIR